MARFADDYCAAPSTCTEHKPCEPCAYWMARAESAAEAEVLRVLLRRERRAEQAKANAALSLRLRNGDIGLRGM